MASDTLLKVFRSKGIRPRTVQMQIMLADRICRPSGIDVYNVTLQMVDRVINTDFINILGAKNNSTLIGIDAIEKLKIVINTARQAWRFVGKREYYDYASKREDPRPPAVLTLNAVTPPSDWNSVSFPIGGEPVPEDEAVHTKGLFSTCFESWGVALKEIAHQDTGDVMFIEDSKGGRMDIAMVDLRLRDDSDEGTGLSLSKRDRHNAFRFFRLTCSGPSQRASRGRGGS